jgi:hypothetical protein
MSKKLVSYNTNEVKRSYYINLYSANAEIRKSANGLKNAEFSWNIRDLQLGSIAEIGLVQMTHNNGTDNGTYCIRCLETYADGYDGFNQTSAILHLSNALHSPETPTYHKIISNNLNKITLVITDNITSATAIYGGINTNISFAVVLHVIDYLDSQNIY